jgi:hypothetical protein
MQCLVTPGSCLRLYSVAVRRHDKTCANVGSASDFKLIFIVPTFSFASGELVWKCVTTMKAILFVSKRECKSADWWNVERRFHQSNRRKV